MTLIGNHDVVERLHATATDPLRQMAANLDAERADRIAEKDEARRQQEARQRALGRAIANRATFEACAQVARQNAARNHAAHILARALTAGSAR